MLESLRNFFGGGNSPDLKQILDKGATILDVRSKGEYDQGHVEGSINIPVEMLVKNLNRLDKNKPIVTCCASGMRSGTAKSILEGHGFEVHNGGGWMSVERCKNQN